MQLALKPYVTTGVAIVGASVIAVAPIVPTPTEIQVPNPIAVVDRGVQLTSSEIEDAINQLIFVGAQVTVTLAKLPAPLVAQLLDVDPAVAEILLSGAALGLLGPLISGPGAIGHSIQDVVNQLGSFNLEELVNTLIGVPATIIDGFVNGGFGPNLDSLFLNTGLLTFLAGGLINPGNISLLEPSIVPGTIPALQALVGTLLEAVGVGGGGTMATTLLTPVESEGQIEGAVNALLLNLVATPIVTVTGFLGNLLAPIIGAEEAARLPLAALGLFGPLISGPGAVGTAIQDVVDSLGSGNFVGILNTLIGAPATVIDGFVNGGYGPDLASLTVPLIAPELPPELFPDVRAGGLINPEDIQGVQIPVPPFFLPTSIKLPGTIPTIQQLVSQIFGLLPGLPGVQAPEEATAPETFSASTFEASEASNRKLVTLDVVPDSADEGKVKGNSKNTPGGPTVDLKADLPTDANVPAKVDEIKQALETPPGPARGKAVAEAAKPDKATGKPTVTTDATAVDTTDGNKVVPETTGSDNAGNGKKKGGGGSNPVGSAISSVAKNLAGAVRGALGG